MGKVKRDNAGFFDKSAEGFDNLVSDAILGENKSLR